MTQSLCTVLDLVDFPGAPFPDSVVESACEAVRDAAGWHIAPSMAETFVVDGHGGHVVTVPTRRLTSIVEVRDMLPEVPRVLSGWRKNRAGLVTLQPSCWPEGLEAIEIDATHGYDTCPPALFPLIAELCQMSSTSRAVKQESSGTESATYSLMVSSAQDDYRLAKYRIVWSP